MIKIEQLLRIHSRIAVQLSVMDFFYPVIIQRWAKTHILTNIVIGHVFFLLLLCNYFMYRLYLDTMNFKYLSLFDTLPSLVDAVFFFFFKWTLNCKEYVYVRANHTVYLGKFQSMFDWCHLVMWLIDFPNKNWDPIKFETATLYS